MSSFPDVLSAELTSEYGVANRPTFTVPAKYEFAVVQVCLIPTVGVGVDRGMVIATSHGSFSFDGYNSNTASNDGTFKDFPILNLIIKGGESFSLLGIKVIGNYDNRLYGPAKAKVTALCHKKPS